MRYWIVKGRPSENDFAKWLKPGREDRWQTGRPPIDWAYGDRLFFWKTAPDLAIVGVGEFVKADRRQPIGEPTRFWVRYRSPMFTAASAVHIYQLRRDRLLKSASFLKPGPSSTLYPLSEAQGQRLFALVVARNASVVDVWPDLRSDAVSLIDVDLPPVVAHEGARRLVQHLRVERDRRLVEAKKREVLANGPLACEVCGFDFAQRYGSVGEHFCEVHHRRSLALRGTGRTTLRDLAVVCSNCHRMLHRTDNGLSIAALRRRLQTTPSIETNRRGVLRRPRS